MGQFLMRRAPFLLHINIKRAVLQAAIRLQNPPLTLHVSRQRLLESSLSAWSSIKRLDLRRRLKVAFDGESTVDINGEGSF